MDGYNFLSQPSLSNTGGVGLFLRDDIKFSIRDNLSISENDFEALWVDLEIHGLKFLRVALYRHPKASLDSFTNYLYSSLDKIHNQNKLCVILGDFNIDLLNCNSHALTENFINTLSSYFLHSQIIQPTRITDHTATLIDNIFINSIDYFTISGNLLSDLCDHLPNFLIIEKNCNNNNETEIFKRDYSQMNESLLVS